MSNVQIEVRSAAVSDTEAVEALYRILVNDSNVCVSADHLRSILEDQKTILLVAERSGSVVGTALVCICSDVMYRDQPFAVVENIVVAPESRGNGVGAALLRSVERLCREKNCSKIMLLSSVERAEAHQFFERVGFQGSRKKGFVKYRRQFSNE